MTRKAYIFYYLFFFSVLFSKAQIAINEVSQGSSGTKEYAELVVVGNPTCTTVATVDLRGYIFDDNNGLFGTSGVANGCMRLSNDPLWSAVPAGTIILLYNDADQEPTIPAQDLSLTDGNCKLVIPVSNCTLIEKNTALPTTTNSVYPTTFTSCGSWGTVGLANSGGDTFQVRDALGNVISAVSYGTNTTNNMVYVSSLGATKVTSNLNGTDTNPYNSANWVVGNVPADETPGVANNAANLAWINSMNFTCGTIMPTVLTATISSANTGCTCLGSATVAASGAIAPYTYSWSPVTSNTTSVSNLCPGNYSVTVSSANGCVQTVSVSITQTISITATVSTTDVLCNGGNTGSATVAVTNGTNPINYTWSPTGGNNATASNLSAGNYSVSIIDANSCTVTASGIINEPNALNTALTFSNVICNGGNTGSATVTPNGGTSPYSYTWSPSGGNSNVASNLSAGTYSVHISDAHLCTKDTFVVISEPTALTLTLSNTPETCSHHNGTATATAAGGTGTLHYTWNPNLGSTNAVSNIQAGTYTLTITDDANCSITNTVIVQGFLAPVLSINTTSVLCNGGNTGAATSTITTGGTPAYTYTWFPTGGNNANASNLTAGNYTLVVSDFYGCGDTAYANILEPAAITATLSGTPATCGNINGTTTCTVSGGVGGYTYTWSPTGGNNANATNLTSGNYTVNISDANACTYSASVFVGNKPTPVLSITSTSITCFGGIGSASVNINANTGTAPFTYTWSPTGGNNANANNLLAGNYTVTVSDSANCTATATIDIVQPTAITATITNTAASCNQTNATTTVTTNGGTGTYSYTWTPTGGNNNTASNLAAGNYTVNISDGNLCAASFTTQLTQNPAISISVTATPATCGNINGTATAIATGGIPAQSGLTYTWSTSPIQTTATATNLTGNTNYAVFVSDSVGCVATKTITIANKPQPVLSVSSTSVACFGMNTATASVSINTNTGTAPFTYTWSPIGGNNAGATNLPSGNYTVTVTDSANCVATASLSISQPPALTVTATSTLATCGNSNGMASCNVSGGTGSYTYTWTPGNQHTATINNIAGNITYTVAVSDANACIKDTSVFVNYTPPLTLSVTSTQNVTCNGGSDGSINVNSSGSVNTTYAWSPNGATSANTSNLTAGSYTLTGNDGGCTNTVTATITQPAPVVVSVNSATICTAQTATLSVSGANTYTWNTNQNSVSIQVSPTVTTTYSVVGQNTLGCLSQPATATVSVYPALSISVTPTSATVCPGASTVLAASASGGNGANNFNWSTGATTTSISVAPTNNTTYTVSVHNAACALTASTTAQVQIYATPTISISSTKPSGCEYVCVSFSASATSATNNAISSYNWDFGDGNTYSSANGNAGHCYNYPKDYSVSLTAITQNNCSVSITQPNMIHVYHNPTAMFTATPSFTITADEGLIKFYDHSQSNITQWNWLIDTATFTTPNTEYNFINEGTYSVTLFVTDTNGCTDSTTNLIVVEPTYAFYAPNAFTPNSDEKNPLFLPLGTGWDTTSYNLHIFDRWGNSILHTTNPNQGWDGTKGGKPVQEDTYVWIVDLYDLFGNPHQYKGQITVIR